MMTLAEAAALDVADPLAPLRERFMRPDSLIYLDGNSLGMLPQASVAASADMVERQGRAADPQLERRWIDVPTRIGGRIAPLTREAGEVIAADRPASICSSCLSLHCVAIRRVGSRVSEGNFRPTCTSRRSGRVRARGRIARGGARRSRRCAGRYRRAAAHPRPLQDRRASTWRGGPPTPIRWRVDAWDLSHSAGAVAVDLMALTPIWRSDAAINSERRARAPAYLLSRSGGRRRSAIRCRDGCHAAPFAFTDDYVAAPGVKRG